MTRVTARVVGSSLPTSALGFWVATIQLSFGEEIVLPGAVAVDHEADPILHPQALSGSQLDIPVAFAIDEDQSNLVESLQEKLKQKDEQVRRLEQELQALRLTVTETVVAEPVALQTETSSMTEGEIFALHTLLS